MSKVRSDNISNRADDGAPALVYGAEVPVGYGITGAGGINITGVATATSFSGNITGGTVSGTTGTFTGNVNTGPVLTVTGTEGISANLYLIADDGDDNGDGWRINSNQDDNDLTISNNTTGSYVDKFTLLKTGELTLTNDLIIPDKIIHTGDTNTAIRFPAADTITAETAGSERLRITSAGKVGVGANNPQELLQVGAGANSVNGTLLISADAGFHNFIRFTNGGGTESHYPSGIWYQPSGRMELRVASSASASNEAQLVLASNGNIGIGTDNPESALHIVGTIPSAPTKLGVHIGAHSGYGIMQFSAATGGFIDFGESGVDSAGRIIYTHSDDTLKLQTANAVRLTIDSDGIKFGSDTAAANALDDYEEGTWTATCDNSVTLHSTVDLCSYTKIGRQVTVTGQIRVDNPNGNAALIINNMPFNCATSTEGESFSVGSIRLYNAGITGTAVHVICISDAGTNNILFQEVRDNNSPSNVQATQDGYYMFTMTYFTAS